MILEIEPLCDITMTLLLHLLYFVRSGLVDINIVCIRYAGIDGAWWSPSAASNIWGNAGLGANYFRFYVTEVNPSNGPSNRWIAFPLRA